MINFYYEEGDAGDFPPKLENINITNLHVEKAERAFVLRGFDHTPITGVNLKNITIDSAKNESIIDNIDGFKQTAVMVNGKAVRI